MDAIRSRRLVVRCPQCGQQHAKTLRELERDEQRGGFACGCGTTILPENAGKTVRDLEQTVAKGIGDLRKAIRKLGR